MGAFSYLPSQLFILAVTIAAIAPRMPLDKPWTIGGNLSGSFRRLLLVIFFIHTGSAVMKDFIPKSVFIVIYAIEIVLLSLICLLTPYLLRVWLSGRINVGRRPGQALEGWLQLIAVLSMMGAILRVATGNRQLWILTKIANCLSFIPVTRTLTLYNSVTNSQVRYPGRGSVVSQVVLVVEYFALLVYLADGASKLLGLLGLVSKEQLNSSSSPIMAGIYATDVLATYTRVLCHSILLNVLDEAYTIGSASAPTDDAESQNCEGNGNTSSYPGPVVETVFDSSEERIALVN
jgi:hypothetical protein